jgi:hypothetical protein
VDSGTADRYITPETLDGTVALPGCLIAEEVFEADGTWTKPAGCALVEVTVVGGGGGGAGAQCTVSPEWRLAGAGAGGAVTIANFLASNLSSTAAVVVGAAGSGGAAGNNSGSAGGTSSFNGTSGSYYLTAGGGGAGISTVADFYGSNGVGGQSGGTGFITNSRIRIDGQDGGGGAIAGGAFSGTAGGGCAFSQAIALPTGVPLASGGTLGGAGSPKAWGCGGGGAAIQDSVQSRAGTNGLIGVVIVRSYG